MKIQVSLTEIKNIFQAGARFGYSKRSKMAGAKGGDDPDFEEFLALHYPQFQEEYDFFKNRKN